MDLTNNDIEQYLSKIFTGKDIRYINDGKEDVCIVFKHPRNVDKIMSDVVYEKAYKKALKEGLLPIKDLEELIVSRGIYTEEDEKKVERIKSKIYAQEVLLSKTTIVKANSDRIKNVIDNLKKELNEVLYKKNSKLMMSAESKAEEDKSTFLCGVCTYDINDNLYWNTHSHLLKETNVIFKNNIMTEFLSFHSGIDTKIIRYIARSNLWRIRYVTSVKTSELLFGVPTSEYSNDMLNLVYWSNYYQNIYEMMPEDRPPDSVIDDDEALDSYMKSYYEERNREASIRRNKNKTGGKLSAFDKEEVIVTQSNELYEEISYDKPREAQRIKDKTDIRKKVRRRRRR